ncbi:MAG TPA: CoA transferase [Dehalococcoidia bacterium]|nr:CoA transferase [Dehalococcoidia bacterium]
MVALDPPLAGVRVLELAGVEGQYCGKLLGDMGADVIKVEPPAGDGARRLGPFAGDVPDINRSLPFWYHNTSKRGITLNIGQPAGQALFRRLAACADVILESSSPGYLASVNLGFDALSQVRSELILVSLTPFGQTGPWSGFRSSDIVSLALGGTMAMNGYDDLAGSPPIRPDGDHAFLIGSEYAFIAVLLALIERQKSQQGQWLDVSIHEACACTTEGAFANWEYQHRVVRRQTARHAQANSTAPWQHRTVDGRYVNLMGGGIPRIFSSWRPLVAWMTEAGKGQDLTEERYESVVHRSPTQRTDPDSLHVLEVLGSFVRSLPAEEVYRQGQVRRLPWAIVRSPEENLDDPHWRERGFLVDIAQPQIGRHVTVPGAPYRFSRTTWRIGRRAPLLGEHNVEVYQTELGLSRDELRGLFEQGVI